MKAQSQGTEVNTEIMNIGVSERGGGEFLDQLNDCSFVKHKLDAANYLSAQG